MCQHASWGAPTPLLDEITNYVHKRRELSERSAIIERAKKVHDDGYACKLVRALAPGELICKPWEISEKFRIKRWHVAAARQHGYGCSIPSSLHLDELIRSSYRLCRRHWRALGSVGWL